MEDHNTYCDVCGTLLANSAGRYVQRSYHVKDGVIDPINSEVCKDCADLYYSAD